MTRRAGEYRYARQDEAVQLREEGWVAVGWMHHYWRFVGPQEHRDSLLLFRPKKRTERRTQR